MMGGPGGLASGEVLKAGSAVTSVPSKTKADIIAFGGVAEDTMAGLRSSDRLRAQPFADATQMERAMMIAQRRDDLLSQGTNLNKNFSLLSFSQEEIVQKASRIGVSLGGNEKSRLAAAKLIQDNEIQRSLVMLKKQ
jgi:hypothetical protein